MYANTIRWECGLSQEFIWGWLEDILNFILWHNPEGNKLFLIDARIRGLASVNINPDLNLAIVSTKQETKSD